MAGEKISILSFGCGNGTKDRAILAAISSCLSEDAKILYHAVDPAASEMEKFKKAVQNENESQQPFKKVDLCFFTQTYEHYTKENKFDDLSSKANLILLIDSLCHFSSSIEDALVHCYGNVLAQNGVILVLQWNDQDFWFKIREVFGKGSVRIAEEGNDYLTIQEVHNIAVKHGWKFEFFYPEYSLDVTECLKPDSKDGKYLLECLTDFSNVRKEVDADPMKLLKFVQESSSKSGDKYMMKGKLGVLVIHKQ